ncbi:MAG: YihY/virulence factor BrkB family protein [Bacteroidales bacterium]|nr:YihY/virulence factor BrkB family protein [Bacteroidales bacterium]
MKIGDLIVKAKEFLEMRLWHIQDTPIGKANRRLFGLLQIVVLTAKGYIEGNVTVRASALTYFTLLSIVPVLALGFAISKGFGLEQYLIEYIHDNLGAAPETAEYLIEFSRSALENTKGGLIAGVGVVMLFYSVFKLLSNIEDAFNKMWCISKSRTLVRKVTDYISMMLFAPILIVMSSSATLFLGAYMKSHQIGGYLTPIQENMVNFVPYVLVWTVFTLLYLIMPNTKVNFKAALISGIITGTVFQLVQWVYITFQVGVNNAGSIYGSFAFFPLFLAWLQLTWTIVLAGCKIAFAIQNVSKYSLEQGTERVSHSMEKKMATLIMWHVVDRFVNKQESTEGLALANELEISQSFFYKIVEKLKACNLIAEVTGSDDEQRGFLPAIDVSLISANEISDRLEKLGDDNSFHTLRGRGFGEVSAMIDELWDKGNGGETRLLKEMSLPEEGEEGKEGGEGK